MLLTFPSELKLTVIDFAVLGVRAILLLTLGVDPFCDADTVHVAPGFSESKAPQLVLAVTETVNEPFFVGFTTNDASSNPVEDVVMVSPLPELEYCIV